MKLRILRTRWMLNNIRIYFEPRDIWVGVYWNKDCDWILSVYICILPLLPIRLYFMKAHETYYEDKV